MSTSHYAVSLATDIETEHASDGTLSYYWWRLSINKVGSKPALFSELTMLGYYLRTEKYLIGGIYFSILSKQRIEPNQWLTKGIRE